MDMEYLFDLLFSDEENNKKHTYTDTGESITIFDYYSWHVARVDGCEFDQRKSGKWMSRFSEDRFEWAKEITENAVLRGICKEAKCSLPQRIHEYGGIGTIILYGEIDDFDFHKSCTQYMIENNMIQKTKKGRLYNIGFKLDEQTREGQYGKEFLAELKLEDIRSLDTGEWKKDN